MTRVVCKTTEIDGMKSMYVWRAGDLHPPRLGVGMEWMDGNCGWYLRLMTRKSNRGFCD